MTEVLRSPFTIGFCVVAILAWVLTLLAIFWPSQGRTRVDKERNGHF
jgi:hypothetical protein